MASVVLVDDNPDLREVTGHLLNMHGHSVRFVVSAEDAIKELAEQLPDVLISDHRLPGMSGLELLTRVRRDPTCQGVRLILYSADDTKQHDAVAAGADAFWLKGSDKLFDAIAQLENLVNNGQPT